MTRAERGLMRDMMKVKEGEADMSAHHVTLRQPIMSRAAQPGLPSPSGSATVWHAKC
eukprot:SAG31_NODE_285_length_18479_cov_9.871980_2_plen_57_part_00